MTPDELQQLERHVQAMSLQNQSIQLEAEAAHLKRVHGGGPIEEGYGSYVDRREFLSDTLQALGVSVQRCEGWNGVLGTGDRAGLAVETFEGGVKDWRLDPASTNRFVFETVDVPNYQASMTRALRDLLVVL